MGFVGSVATLEAWRALPGGSCAKDNDELVPTARQIVARHPGLRG
jgi:hypothetical protein